MARTWLVDGRGIARKVKNATSSSNCQAKEWGADVNRECPNCQHTIDNSDVSIEWPGLPAGVKFDPSDLELIDHLAGKVGLENSKIHPLIDEFIPTLEENEGICYTHPENLPGVRKDGNSTHFFHRTSNAYSTGCRKRRKIYGHGSASEEHVRWHKTGKTKSVMDNGIQKGCKKIMVLYKSSKKLKPDKTNWVMHQYHLGTEEDEKNGEYVVSKIFYQQQSSHMEKNDMVTETTQVITSSRSNFEEPVFVVGNGVDPKTPKTVTPDPPKLRLWTSYEYDEDDEDVVRLDSPQNTNLAAIWTDRSTHVTEDAVSPIRLAGESQVECINSTQLLLQSKAAEDCKAVDLDASLLCHEVLDSFQTVEVPGSDMFQCFMGFDPNTDTGIPDLDNIGTCTPPDFNLSDLQFGSQESTMSWIDRL